MKMDFPLFFWFSYRQVPKWEFSHISLPVKNLFELVSKIWNNTSDRSSKYPLKYFLERLKFENHTVLFSMFRFKLLIEGSTINVLATLQNTPWNDQTTPYSLFLETINLKALSKDPDYDFDKTSLERSIIIVLAAHQIIP